MAENAANIGLDFSQFEAQMGQFMGLVQNFMSGLGSMQSDVVKGQKAVNSAFDNFNMDLAQAAGTRAAQMNDASLATQQLWRARNDLAKLDKTSGEDFVSAWSAATNQMEQLQTAINEGRAKATSTGELMKYRSLLGRVQEQLTSGMEDLTKLFKDPVSLLGDMASGLVKLEYLNEGQLKQIEEQYLMLQKLQEIDKLRGEDEKLLKGYEEQIEQLKVIGEHAKKLNVLAELEAKTAEKRKNIAKEIRQLGLDTLADYAEKVTVASVLTDGLKKSINGLVESQERFALASNRATGSIEQLTSASATLNAQLGVTSKEADAAVSSLAGLAVPYEDMRKLAESNAAVAVATGATNEQIAKLQRRMMIFDMTTEDVNKHMDMLAGTAREFGLTGDDMNAVMAISEEVMFNLAGATGKTGKELAELTKQFAELAGVAKRAGVDVNKALRGAADATMDPLSQVVLLGDRFGDFTDAINENTVAGRKRAQQIRLEAMAETARDMPKDIVTAKLLAGAYGTTQEELAAATAMSKEFGKSTEDFNKAAQDKASLVFNERMGTLTKQVSQALETGAAFLKQFMMPFLFAVVKLLQALNLILTPVRLFVGWLQALSDEMEKATGWAYAWRAILTTLIKVGGGLIIFALATGYIKSFGGILTGTVQMLGRWKDVLIEVAKAIARKIPLLNRLAWAQKANTAAEAASGTSTKGFLQGLKDKAKAMKDWFTGASKGKEVQEKLTDAAKTGATAQKAAAASSAASSTTMAGGAKALDKGLSWGLILKLTVLVVIFIALVAVMVLLNPSVGLLLALGASMIMFSIGVWILSSALAALAAVGSATWPILAILAGIIFVIGLAALMMGYGMKLAGEAAGTGATNMIVMGLAMMSIAAAIYLAAAAVALLPAVGAALLAFSIILGLSALAIIFFTWALGGLVDPMVAIGKAADQMVGFKYFSKFRTDVDAISTDKLASIATSIAMMGTGLASLIALGAMGAMKHIFSQDNSRAMEQKEKAWRDDMKSKADTSNTHLSQIADNTGAMGDFSDLTDAIKLLISKLGSAAQQQGSSLSSTGEMGGAW